MFERASIPTIVFTLAIAFAAPARAQPADTVLLNGRIATLDASSSIAEAIAVRDGRIAATGSSEQIRGLAGPQTRILDLAGRTVIPGLIDSHLPAIPARVRHANKGSWVGAPTPA